MARYFNGTSSDSLKQRGLPQVATGTIAMWFKLVALPGGTASICTFCNSGDSPGYATYDKTFLVNTSGVPSAYIYDGGLKFANGTTAMVLGKWYHLAMTFNGTTLSMYVNGNLEGTTSAGNSYTGYSGPSFELSTSSGAGSTRPNGAYADVAIWSRILLPSHIFALSRGFSPARMQQSLVSYLSLEKSAIQCLKLRTKPTVVGTSWNNTPRGIMNTVSFVNRRRLGMSISAGSSLVKTVNGLARSSIKTVNGLAIASVKTINGLQ